MDEWKDPVIALDNYNRMKQIIGITFLLLTFLFDANSQSHNNTIATKILTADSCLLVIYNNADSIVALREMIADGQINDEIKRKGHKLTKKDRGELTNILLSKDIFRDRYTTVSGLPPGQAIALWKKGKYSYLEFNLHSKQIFSSIDFGFQWTDIDPHAADKFEHFFSLRTSQFK